MGQRTREGGRDRQVSDELGKVEGDALGPKSPGADTTCKWTDIGAGGEAAAYKGSPKRVEGISLKISKSNHYHNIEIFIKINFSKERIRIRPSFFYWL